ncbi:hypothetical protein M9Y10_015447 [Tritrichomonas musculus]|uniref:Leucine-rich repeat domain, L domain-containing protein n=1 Tax=Tritrichomonas musculus TaxID=1915356 RepID=A0ABR2L2T3_9EUKA
MSIISVKMLHFLLFLITKFSSNCFSYCISLLQIEILSLVFSRCASLSELKLPSSLTIIESFVNCQSLSILGIPSSVTTIKRYSFYGCHSLSSVLIPFSVSLI